MKARKILLLEKMLRLMAKLVLIRHKPKIVAITGSVGKTSTKAAVFAVLSQKFNVRENQKNYNNEIGIPLTIIGTETGGRNIFKWLWVFFKWILVLIWKDYPEILILELGIDRPGDMKYFTSFVKPTVSIITNVSLSHIEFFRTIENIAKEKGVLVETMLPDGVAILNSDDENVLKMQQKTLAQIFTFGLNKNAKLNADNVVYNYQNEKPDGISFKINFEGNNIPVRLRHILAKHYVHAAMSAIAAGLVFKLNLLDITKSLEDLHSPTGRMNLFDGINNSSIIDDTYNASPMSTVAALNVLGEIKAGRRIAILGDMLELGNMTKRGHMEVANKVSEIKADLVVAVGDRMKLAVDELIALGFPSSKILKFDDPQIAAEKIKNLIITGDFVLVKGSQGMRMEKIVKMLLKNVEDENLLCRQSKAWLKKSFIKP
jgi:UDP-N-acetylmuramoyl-tripeptide--D-alanyl-D-alanine ligase